VTIHIDLPEDLAARLLARPEAERNLLAATALREKLDSECKPGGGPAANSQMGTDGDDFRVFIDKVAATVASGGGVERITRAEMYARR
jgi:hypothetical protein